MERTLLSSGINFETKDVVKLAQLWEVLSCDTGVYVVGSTRIGRRWIRRYQRNCVNFTISRLGPDSCLDWCLARLVFDRTLVLAEPVHWTTGSIHLLAFNVSNELIPSSVHDNSGTIQNRGRRGIPSAVSGFESTFFFNFAKICSLTNSHEFDRRRCRLANYS